MTPTTVSEAEREYGWMHLFPEFNGTRRFSTAEYRKLIDAGILGPADRVECLDGYILHKSDYVQPLPSIAFPEWRLLRRWSAEDVQHMIQIGVIKQDERFELLDGYLVPKMPMSKAHRNAIMRLAANLPPHLPAGWMLMQQCPVALGTFDPEPDGAIIRGTITDYEARDVVATDFGIVIEVCDSTLEFDRLGKGRGYAREGILVYWIVNVADRQIEVYTGPTPTGGYTIRADYKPGDSVPITLDGVASGAIAVSEIIV